ncbi:MAG: pyridine nucleotide-disulfide oxidoreductase [Gordonia sp. (in: high G+C Gram-positive bacteria)]|uniref:pyridine nucleotide-disulfide oxidoreductase n=1 Tax=Gordonia sp. (in: high G+C Gram-positive bacteria) TaxID=84139 RepID=UPI0039E23948
MSEEHLATDRSAPGRLAASAVLTVTACAAALGLIAACGPAGSPITRAADVSAGDCLTVRDGLFDARKSDCDGSDRATFYVAESLSQRGDCDLDTSSYLFEGMSLDFDGTGEKLCLTPNLTVSHCYQVPLPAGRLPDFRQVGCDARAAQSTVVVRLVERAESDVVCTGDTMKWSFTKPASIGYCLRELDS